MFHWGSFCDIDTADRLSLRCTFFNFLLNDLRMTDSPAQWYMYMLHLLTLSSVPLLLKSGTLCQKVMLKTKSMHLLLQCWTILTENTHTTMHTFTERLCFTFAPPAFIILLHHTQKQDVCFYFLLSSTSIPSFVILLLRFTSSPWQLRQRTAEPVVCETCWKSLEIFASLEKGSPLLLSQQ